MVIEVTYTLQAEGYLPYATFNYILETGAGWKDAIGAADFILRMPYETNEMNVQTAPDFYPSSTPNGQFAGNEVRWHFENLEPTHDENAIFQASVVAPHLWQAMLDARQNAAANPNDGDAWGALGRAYKPMFTEGLHHSIRSDKTAREIFALAVEAYEKAIALSPKTSKWYSGYAELLLPDSDVCFSVFEDQSYLYPAISLRTAQLLNTALSLDPENEQALEVLDSAVACGGVVKTDSGFIFYILTETPAPPQPTKTLMPTETPTDFPAFEEPVNPTAKATVTFAPATESPAAQATATTAQTGSGRAPSLCGGVMLAPAAVVGWLARRRRRTNHR